MVIYKYMPYKRFLESITPEGVCLKVSRPCEFNDPFDCAGISKGVPTKELIEEIRTAHTPGLDLFSDSYICNGMSAILSARHTFDGAYRVFSASDSQIAGSEDEMLMWAHYGDSSKGVRIAIEIDSEKIKCKRVRYRNVMPCLKLDMVKSLDPFSDDIVRRFLIECLLTKNITWKYEKERRIVFRVNSPEVRRWPLHNTEAEIGQAMFMWTPPKATIRQVCIGPEKSRSVEGAEEAIRDVCKLNKCGYNIEGVIAVRGGKYGCGQCKLR